MGIEPQDKKATFTTSEDGAKKPVRPRRKPLRLPFDNRKQDIGSWAYDHRVGLFITIIIYFYIKRSVF
jgi:hypothetical protein